MLYKYLIFLLGVLGLATSCQQGSDKSQDQPVTDTIQTEQSYLKLGGEEQYVEIIKTSDDNPVLIIVHGGPGWPQTPQIRYFNQEIAQRFTLVIWEQSGAGKSWKNNPNPKDISLNQIVKDGNELAAMMKERFKQEKVYLAGYSWGSIVGVKMIEQAPENYQAYIGIAQMINQEQNLIRSRQWLRDGDGFQVDSLDLVLLDSLEQGLIEKDMDAFMKQFLLVVKYGGAFYDSTSIQEVEIAQTKYEDYLDYDWMGGFYFSMKYLEDDLTNADLSEINQFDIPIYLILGKNDWNVPSIIAEEWLEEVNAPDKKVFWIEKSGHGLMEENPKRFNKIMLEEIPVL